MTLLKLSLRNSNKFRSIRLQMRSSIRVDHTSKEEKLAYWLMINKKEKPMKNTHKRRFSNMVKEEHLMAISMSHLNGLKLFQGKKVSITLIQLHTWEWKMIITTTLLVGIETLWLFNTMTKVASILTNKINHKHQDPLTLHRLLVPSASWTHFEDSLSNKYWWVPSELLPIQQVTLQGMEVHFWDQSLMQTEEIQSANLVLGSSIMCINLLHLTLWSHLLPWWDFL